MFEEGEEDPLDRELRERELERASMMNGMEDGAGGASGAGEGEGGAEEVVLGSMHVGGVGSGDGGNGTGPDGEVLAAMAERLKVRRCMLNRCNLC
jgi:hypothetical protein